MAVHPPSTIFIKVRSTDRREDSVKIEIGPGVVMTASITNEAVDELRLAMGDQGLKRRALLLE